MPNYKLKVVQTSSYPEDSKNNRNDTQRGADTEYFYYARRNVNTTVPVKITSTLLLDFIKSGRMVRSDSRSINYLISTLCPNSSDLFTLLTIWLIYKEALLLNKIDLSTAILMVQASGNKVIEQGKPSRLYYIKAAHAYTLKAKNGSQRFYINLVHALYSCGCKDLADVYTQIQDPAFNISLESRDKLKTMLDAAVQEYKTFGFREHVVYADDQRLPQPQSATEKHPTTNHVYQAKQLLHKMAVHVDKQIKDHCSKFSDPLEKVEEINTQTPTVAEKMESPNKETVLLNKQQHYISAIECAAEEKNWINAMAIFDQAITEIPNNSLIYNAMLLAADKCNCDALYAKHLYARAIAENFADTNTHINALLVFSKRYSELNLAWYAYSKIKRLGGLNTTICSLMATVALLHNAAAYVIAVLNDVAENRFDPPTIINDRARVILEDAKGVTQLEDRSAILEASAGEHSTTPQINITGNVTVFSPLLSSLAQSGFSLFRVPSSVPNQVPKNSFSYTR